MFKVQGERVFIYQQIPVALVLTIEPLFPATSQPLLKNPGHVLEKSAASDTSILTMRHLTTRSPPILVAPANGRNGAKAVRRGVSAATLRQMVVQTEHMTTWIEAK